MNILFPLYFKLKQSLDWQSIIYELHPQRSEALGPMIQLDSCALQGQYNYLPIYYIGLAARMLFRPQVPKASPWAEIYKPYRLFVQSVNRFKT